MDLAFTDQRDLDSFEVEHIELLLRKLEFLHLGAGLIVIGCASAKLPHRHVLRLALNLFSPWNVFLVRIDHLADKFLFAHQLMR